MVNKPPSFLDFKDEDEYPIQPETAGAYRTETYNQWVYDPEQDIGMNIWFASGDGAFPNFMSTVIIFLKGETWVARSQGHGNHPGGIAAGNAFLTMEQAFKRWKLDYLGLLSRSKGPQPFTTDPAESQLARLDLTVHILSPPIEQGTQGDRGETASSGTIPRTAMRYEQLCRISGPMTIGSKSVTVNALGMRSHRCNSASIYDSGAVGHTWATALFPSGHGFHLLSYQIEPKAEVGLLYGHYFDGQRYHEADVLKFPYFTGETSKESSALVMKVRGKTMQIEVESFPPLVSNIPPQGVRLTRSAARFTLEGEVGGGVLERSLMPDFPVGGYYLTPSD